MSDRGFNSPASPAEIKAVWASLPDQLRILLETYRADAVGFPAIVVSVAVTIDVALLVNRAGDDASKAAEYIVDELIAAAETSLAPETRL